MFFSVQRGANLTTFPTRECFTPIVDMKFRKALEPSVNARAGTSKRPKLKASGNLCLGFSGGLGSSILLDIVHNTYFFSRPPLDDSGKPRGGINHPRNASVWPSCIVCYVETCGAFAGVSRDHDLRLRFSNKFAARCKTGPMIFDL